MTVKETGNILDPIIFSSTKQEEDDEIDKLIQLINEIVRATFMAKIETNAKIYHYICISCQKGYHRKFED